MADAQLKLSRRALLGAACAAPLLRHSGLDPESTSSFIPAWEKKRWMSDQVRHDDKRTVTNWDRALARFRRAEAGLTAAQGNDDDHLYDRLLGRHNKALSRLLRIPAPHPPALAEKLDLLVEHEVWELTFAKPCLAALRRDARALAAAQDHPGFPFRGHNSEFSPPHCRAASPQPALQR